MLTGSGEMEMKKQRARILVTGSVMDAEADAAVSRHGERPKWVYETPLFFRLDRFPFVCSFEKNNKGTPLNPSLPFAESSIWLLVLKVI